MKSSRLKISQNICISVKNQYYISVNHIFIWIKEMNFREFTQIFDKKLPISVQNIRMQQPSFALQQLHIWREKWRLKSIKRWWWIFPESLKQQWIWAIIANSIYEPSYLSLERALRFYNLIPEWVHQYTSCTTKKTSKLSTISWEYVYRSFVPHYYRGYNLYNIWIYNAVRIASPEKALCDYLYFHPEITEIEDFEEMRFNIFVWTDTWSNQILQNYSSQYPTRIQKQIQNFLSFLNENYA